MAVGGFQLLPEMDLLGGIGGGLAEFEGDDEVAALAVGAMDAVAFEAQGLEGLCAFGDAQHGGAVERWDVNEAAEGGVPRKNMG